MPNCSDFLLNTLARLGLEQAILLKHQFVSQPCNNTECLCNTSAYIISAQKEPLLERDR